MVSLVDQARIQADDIALLNDVILVGDAVHHFIIDRHADGGRISIVIQERRDAAEAADDLLADAVDVHGGHARFQRLLHLIVSNFQKPSGLSHEFNLSG